MALRLALTVPLLALLIILLIAPSAQARPADPPAVQSTTTFATTAAFDAGNKSDPGPVWVASNGVDSPFYSWLVTPPALYVNGYTFVVYQGGGSAYRPYILRYNHATATWAGPYVVNTTNPVAGDGHGAPSVFVDSSGYIYIPFGSHSTALQIRKSTNPYDPTSFSSLPNFLGTAGTVSYPNMWSFGSSIYLLYREGSPSGGAWKYVTSTNGGTSWSAPTTFLDMGAPDGAYIGQIALVGDRIYIPWVKFQNSDVLRHNLYAAYLNLTTGHAFSMSGTDLGTGIDAAEAAASCLIDNTGTAQVWSASSSLDSSGHLYLIYHRGGGAGLTGTWRFNYTRWTGSAWTGPVDITGSNDDANSNYAALVATSSSSVTAYLTGPSVINSVAASQFSGDLQVWTLSGSTWSHTSDILDEMQARLGLNFPFVVRNGVAPLKLVFGQWTGEYTDYPVRVYAWGPSGFVRYGNLSSGTWNMETITDNPFVPSNALTLRNALSDQFTRNLPTLNSTFWNMFQSWSPAPTSPTVAYIRNGMAMVNMTTPGDAGAISTFNLTGAFDIRIKVNLAATNVTTTNTINFFFGIANEPSECQQVTESNTVDGLFIRYVRTGTGSAKLMETYICTNGVASQVGPTPTVNMPAWVRIVNNTNSWSTYYSTDGITWNSIYSSFGFTLNGPRHALFLNDKVGAAGKYINYTFSDFRVAAGSVDSWANATSGTWTSAGQTPTADIFRYVNVTYSGATADRYISSMSLLNGTGVRVYTDNTHLTSGMSHVYVVPGLVVSGNWKVELSLTGDGSGSVVVSSIVVAYTPNVPPSLHPTIITVTVYIGNSYSQPFTATDPDNQTLTFSFHSNNVFLLFGASNHTVYGNPSVVGVFFVNVSVSDGFVSVHDNYTLFAIEHPFVTVPTFDTNGMIFILFILCVFGLGLGGFALEQPILVIFAGISGFGFMTWFLVTTGFGILTVILLGISAFFLLGGALYAIGEAS